jgi:hypothetical protein
MKNRGGPTLGATRDRSDFAIPRPVVRDSNASSSSSSSPIWSRWLINGQRWRVTLLLAIFWLVMLTLALLSHMSASSSSSALRESASIGHQRFMLTDKLNLMLETSAPYDTFLTYRICCLFPGGHMECPDARELECHLVRDEGPRMSCYWIAPRLINLSCIITHWSAKN